MAYLDGLLSSGESVRVRAHRHVLFLILHSVPYLVATLALWVVAFVVARNVDTGGNIGAVILLLVSLVPLGIAAKAFLDWKTEEYIVTNFRIIQVEGLLNKKTFDSALEKVNDVMMTQSIFGRLFGYGTIEIITGSDIGVNNLAGIAEPAAFKRALVEAKTQLEHGDRFQVGEPAHDGLDAARLLAALTDLRDSGVITPDEYETRRQELLRR